MPRCNKTTAERAMIFGLEVEEDGRIISFVFILRLMVQLVVVVNAIVVNVIVADAVASK